MRLRLTKTRIVTCQTCPVTRRPLPTRLPACVAEVDLLLLLLVRCAARVRLLVRPLSPLKLRVQQQRGLQGCPLLRRLQSKQAARRATRRNVAQWLLQQ